MWFEMRSSTCLSLLLISASSLPVQGLPAQQRAIFPSIGPLDDVLLFDAPAFVDGNNLVASVQAFVSLRQINLTPFLSAVQSALEDAFDLDIGNKVAQVEERLRLFAAIGQSGKDVNVKVGGCSAAASGSGASVGKTSKLPDLGMVLGSAPLGSCAQKTGAFTGTVEDKGTIITDARKFENTIFASGPDGFGVISDIDDTVKITNTLDKLGVVKSTLLDDPTPVSGMPSLYASLSKSLATSAPPQFIYVSGSPFQLYPFLRSFISTSFPESRGPLLLQNLTLIDIPGLLDFAQSDGIFEYKSAMIQRIQSFYPAKKWLTVGDSTQKDPETYANAFRTFGPDFIACIWIRRVDGADNSDARFAEAFQGVPQDKFRVFSDGDIPGLASIDIKGGSAFYITIYIAVSGSVDDENAEEVCFQPRQGGQNRELMDFTHFSAALAVGVASLFVMKAKQRPNYPPGPPADPLIGHLRSFLIASKQLMTSWRNEARFTATDPTYFVGMNDIVLMPYGESFRKHRKFVHSTITKRAITTFQPVQTKNARALALNLLENKNRHEMFFNMFATSVITGILYGHQVVSEDDEYMKLMDHQSMIAVNLGQPGGALLDIFPFLQHLPAWFPGTGPAARAREWRPMFRRVYDYPYEQVEKKMSEGVAEDSILGRVLAKFSTRSSVPEEEIEYAKLATGAMYRAAVETPYLIDQSKMMSTKECSYRKAPRSWPTGMALDEKTYKNPSLFNPSRFLPKPDGDGEPLFGSAFGFGRR
ncbi:hypothetical protein EYR38_003537 [Pleurotus pulmonarius]|nr:hypothetical protein EYR38_003537 [Pleurotus pulmonarius]